MYVDVLYCSVFKVFSYLTFYYQVIMPVLIPLITSLKPILLDIIV